MSRRLIVIALALGGSRVALADPTPAPADATPAAPPVAVAPPDMTSQAIGGSVGLAIGGRDTPGGLALAGHYLYQLSDRDWFDGAAAFTFGGGGAACFRDRDNNFVCEHGALDGVELQLQAGVRRYFHGQGEFWPFAHASVGISYVRFHADDLTGFTIPLALGGGMRASVSPSVAVVVEAQLAVGVGWFSHGLGTEPQLGAAVVAGAEFHL